MVHKQAGRAMPSDFTVTRLDKDEAKEDKDFPDD